MAAALDVLAGQRVVDVVEFQRGDVVFHVQVVRVGIDAVVGDLARLDGRLPLSNDMTPSSLWSMRQFSTSTLFELSIRMPAPFADELWALRSSKLLMT